MNEARDKLIETIAAALARYDNPMRWRPAVDEWNDFAVYAFDALLDNRELLLEALKAERIDPPDSECGDGWVWWRFPVLSVEEN